MWLRQSSASNSQRVVWFTQLTLFITFDLVLFGAFTRLTDSGLGCPDWPGCYGFASPVGAVNAIEAAQTAMPTGPVTHQKAWIEMIHRYMAMGVGGCILTLAWFAWSKRSQGSNTKLPTLTLLWVCVQGGFGALTVTMKLFPAIVTLHLLGGLVLLALLTIQIYQQRQVTPIEISSRLYGSAWICAALLLLQILSGGWVSTNYAVLACNTFPQCQDSWWPLMDFANGFTVWRPLGLDAMGGSLTFEALTAIHYVHRLSAYVVFIALGALAWRLLSVNGAKHLAKVLGALLLLQLLTGLSNVVLDWPLIAAVVHTGGAAALCITMVWLLCIARKLKTV
jgi:cytochrome c oxidase assembly protein subunit 15